MNVPIRNSPRGPQKTAINHASYIRSPRLDLKPKSSHKEEMEFSDQRHSVVLISQTSSPEQQTFGTVEVTVYKATQSALHLGDR